MDIVSKISNLYVLDAEEYISNRKKVDELIMFSPIEIPSDFINFISSIKEIEIKVNNEMYIRIWDLDNCIERNEIYSVQEFIPKSLVIGDDEGDNAIIYMDGENGFGLYLVGYGALAIEEGVFISYSLSDLLINNIGIDVLLDTVR